MLFFCFINLFPFNCLFNRNKKKNFSDEINVAKYILDNFLKSEDTFKSIVNLLTIISYERITKAVYRKISKPYIFLNFFNELINTDEYKTKLKNDILDKLFTKYNDRKNKVYIYQIYTNYKIEYSNFMGSKTELFIKLDFTDDIKQTSLFFNNYCINNEHIYIFKKINGEKFLIKSMIFYDINKKKFVLCYEKKFFLIDRYSKKYKIYDNYNFMKKNQWLLASIVLI